ncbi:hypothetical protein ABW19_dt0203013 [Dactylella cylindrospora]|nr:hypothetical protein ABW19_dt0203013 [Dactylella cylindrospora]
MCDVDRLYIRPTDSVMQILGVKKIQTAFIGRRASPVVNALYCHITSDLVRCDCFYIFLAPSPHFISSGHLPFTSFQTFPLLSQLLWAEYSAVHLSTSHKRCKAVHLLRTNKLSLIIPNICNALPKSHDSNLYLPYIYPRTPPKL